MLCEHLRLKIGRMKCNVLKLRVVVLELRILIYVIISFNIIRK